MEQGFKYKAFQNKYTQLYQFASPRLVQSIAHHNSITLDENLMANTIKKNVFLNKLEKFESSFYWFKNT